MLTWHVAAWAGLLSSTRRDGAPPSGAGAGGSRAPPLLPRERYLSLCDIYKRRDISRPRTQCASPARPTAPVALGSAAAQPADFFFLIVLGTGRSHRTAVQHVLRTVLRSQEAGGIWPVSILGGEAGER